MSVLSWASRSASDTHCCLVITSLRSQRQRISFCGVSDMTPDSDISVHLQHYLTMLGSTVLIPFLIVPPMGGALLRPHRYTALKQECQIGRCMSPS